MHVMFADGGSRGNPGPAGSGAVLYDPSGKELARASKYLGTATNNVAEYTAIIIGLHKAADLGIKTLAVNLDSELAVKQINGEYRVKNPGLKLLFEEVMDAMMAFDEISFSHVRREKNTVADAIVNETIDAHTGV